MRGQPCAVVRLQRALVTLSRTVQPHHGEDLIGAAMAMTARAADLTGGRYLVVDPNVKDTTLMQPRS